MKRVANAVQESQKMKAFTVRHMIAIAALAVAAAVLIAYAGTAGNVDIQAATRPPQMSIPF